MRWWSDAGVAACRGFVFGRGEEAIVGGVTPQHLKNRFESTPKNWVTGSREKSKNQHRGRCHLVACRKGGTVFSLCRSHAEFFTASWHASYSYLSRHKNQTTPTASNNPAATGTARLDLVNRIRRSSVNANTAISNSSATVTPHRNVAA